MMYGHYLVGMGNSLHTIGGNLSVFIHYWDNVMLLLAQKCYTWVLILASIGFKTFTVGCLPLGLSVGIFVEHATVGV